MHDQQLARQQQVAKDVRPDSQTDRREKPGDQCPQQRDLRSGCHIILREGISLGDGLLAVNKPAGVPVIHVWYIVEAGAPGLRQNAPLFQGVKEANALVRGSWGAAPADGLEPQDGDHVVEKMRMNGFYETRLDILLRGLGADQLIITGAWTNMSIEHTARHGADAGYEVVVASDGTSTTGDEWQNAALNYAMTNVAKVATCAEIKSALGS
jgi:gluconolactonase